MRDTFSLKDVRAPLHMTGWKRDRVEKLGGSIVARSLPIGREDLAPRLQGPGQGPRQRIGREMHHAETSLASETCVS